MNAITPACVAVAECTVGFVRVKHESVAVRSNRDGLQHSKRDECAERIASELSDASLRALEHRIRLCWRATGAVLQSRVILT